jgi:hypothetical protein
MAEAERTTRRTSTGGGRYYTDTDGNRYWSVTTIISGGIPKPALMPWAQKIVGEYAVEQLAPALNGSYVTMRDALEGIGEGNLGAVADLLEAAMGKMAPDREDVLGHLVSGKKTRMEKARKYISAAPLRLRDQAASLGQHVHRAIEAYILEQPMPDFDEDVKPFMHQFDRFLRDWTPEFEVAEATVFNKTKQYAGTLDFTAKFPTLGGLYVCDVKSGRAVYPEVGLQLAAYRGAEFLETKAGSFDMPETVGGMTLHLRPGEYKLLHIECGAEQLRVFEYAREIYRFVQETSKLVIGEPYQVEAQE